MFGEGVSMGWDVKMGYSRCWIFVCVWYVFIIFIVCLFFVELMSKGSR